MRLLTPARAPKKPEPLCPGRTGRLPGVLGLIAFWVGLNALSACTPRGEGAIPPDVEAVVARLEEAVDRRDYAAAHALVDYRYRLGEVLGEFWSSAPMRSQEDLVAFSKTMFEDTSERLRDHFAGRAMRHVLRASKGPHLLIESRPATTSNDDKRRFSWSYRLTRMEGRWTITQREFMVAGTPSDSTRFWPMARKQVASRFGREITFEEFVANLPSVMGTMRVRGITIPDLGPKSQATP